MHWEGILRGHGLAIGVYETPLADDTTMNRTRVPRNASTEVVS